MVSILQWKIDIIRLSGLQRRTSIKNENIYLDLDMIKESKKYSLNAKYSVGFEGK